MANYKKILIVGLSVIIIQAIQGVAQASVSQTVLMFLDRDKDGLISLKEATRNITILEAFNIIDMNEDGFISLQELTASNLVKE